jgi:hypothetical protein
VTKTREKKYQTYFDGRYAFVGNFLRNLTEQDKAQLRLKETQGTEIVQQIAVCPECELRLTGKCSYSPPSAGDTYTTHLPEKAQVTLTNIPVEYIGIPERKSNNKRS